MNEQTIRAFVAAELPDEIHRLLETRQNALRDAMGRASGAVRWTRPESVHVTLQFLGDVPAKQVPEISAAMVKACEGARPLSLGVGGVGAFPNLGRPRVLWIGLEGDVQRLRGLAATLGQQLAPIGYKPDKPFEPHITLGRVREGTRPDEVRAISQALSTQMGHRATETFFPVRSLSLMQSHLQPGGAVYTRLASAEFAT